MLLFKKFNELQWIVIYCRKTTTHALCISTMLKQAPVTGCLISLYLYFVLKRLLHTLFIFIILEFVLKHLLHMSFILKFLTATLELFAVKSLKWRAIVNESKSKSLVLKVFILKLVADTLVLILQWILILIHVLRPIFEHTLVIAKVSLFV